MTDAKMCIRCHERPQAVGEYCEPCRKTRDEWASMGIKNDGTEEVRCYLCGGTFPHGAMVRKTKRGVTHIGPADCMDALRRGDCRPIDKKLQADVMKSAGSTMAAPLAMLPAHMLTILFIGLKLTGHIDWSWWLVTAPSWVPLAIIIVGTIALLFVGVIIALYGNKKK